ncbi:MAG: high frequency lysogenization protein HflD [Candidatus Thioglobus sp.]|jgi:high frequency lysogenization protein|uniref:high frequency lysogenization protein HflD n=1 Tax=uncultured Candidatus Thioglobus sp. TaxID=655186 RepID=UPI001D841993|nr:high frequency lysogenization protein HflD [Candidatus Thioglobus sp.]MBT4923759.1 high frequency lysogenization protein HflD [Candidatus Thioglobus sp.]MBT5784230.1 high frequency lysogenization protein HflD [Candidatus Thioglobus sp.]MBT7002300.1 high frequency lysogenization protein HflD [Candidatus Thioglobus sp.]MBT7411860.1 high frequency lysogenization protein HflD [Candidatus Thioglobus sp.]
MSKLREQTLALASLLQTTTLVDQLASTGTCDSRGNKVSLQSIVTNSTNVEEVFVSPKDLSTGLNALKVVLGKKSKSMRNAVLYALALINLEKKLMKDQELLTKISDEINTIKGQDFFEISHSNSLARLAELYKSTLGELNPRIMVSGEQIYLSNQHTANHIRALLLAGIRAVSLWKSQGGKTWQLLINKKKALKFVNSMDF